MVAVIVTEPAFTPFIEAVLPGDTPRLSLLLTIATLVSLLAQNIFLAVSVSPFARVGVALSVTVFPTATLSGVGFTLTAATDTGIDLTAEVPLWPSIAAVIVTDPAAAPDTMP